MEKKIKEHLTIYFDRLEKATTDQDRADCWMLIKTAYGVLQDLEQVKYMRINNKKAEAELIAMSE